jgi:excisionase family DNA binding protein
MSCSGVESGSRDAGAPIGYQGQPIERLLLRVEEAAQALGLSRSGMYNLIAAGEIPVVRMGRSVRVPAEELREYVKRNTTGPWSRGIM